MPPNTEEDKVRGLSPHDLRRILGDALLAGVKLLGKKSDDTFENIKSDDEGRLQVYDPKVTSQTDKLAGETPVSGSTTANWNTGTGTSTEAGGDVVTLGANNTKYKLHSLLLDVSALTDGASIHVKLFMQVNGVEKKVYDQTFIVPTGTTPPDTDGLWIVNGTVGIHEALRVEVYSDTDESKAIGYDYMLEAM
ncbi:hypothetical protein ES704_02717 [subsurface metagenome]|jgi:hypothetical protein